ncbi:hypothetical protein FDECE_66 [Fusarium decemcellulare]|nr:hypothetical protein FDECE_66 [Fusarium decemcellulare]
MVVYQALKRILGSARVSAVLDDAEYREYRRDWYGDKDEDDGCAHVSDAPSSAIAWDDWSCQDERLRPDKIGARRRDDKPLYPRRPVTWLNYPPSTQTPRELAVAFNTYGNQPGIDAYYTSAVIIGQVNQFLPSG